MIIFYNKQTGDIAGTIDGRVHNEDHLKMWVGDPNVNDRIIINWKPVKTYVDKETGKTLAQDFEPDCDQKELFVDFETRKKNLRDYRVDLKKLTLKKKS